MKKKGFTLIELLVVVSIIALLMALLLPALARVKAIAARLVCGTNQKAIGAAMRVYAVDWEAYPRAGGVSGNWSSKLAGIGGSANAWRLQDRTLAWGLDADGKNGKVTISASLYLMVKYADLRPKTFVCRSDDDTTAFSFGQYGVRGTLIEFQDVWDFGPDPKVHCSYSYQMPYYNPPAIRPYTILNSDSEADLVILADRSPYVSHGGNSAMTIGDLETQFAWPGLGITSPSGKIKEQAINGNSRAHGTNGQNVLYNDTHVEFEDWSYTGAQDDNIYTFWGVTDMTGSGSDLPHDPNNPVSTPQERQEGMAPVQPGSGAYAASVPLGTNDSLLVNDGVGSSSGGGGKLRTCFPADTPVWVNGALVEISKVTAGHEICMVAGAGVAISLGEVEKLQEHGVEVSECYDIELDGGSSITVIDCHYFLVEPGRWMSVEELTAESRLVSLNGSVGIKRVTKRDTLFVGKSYNLKIKNSDTYLVGEAGVMVRDY